MTRTIAEDKGLPWGMVAWENFKGASFMNLDRGVEVFNLKQEYNEKSEKFEGNEVRDYDWEGVNGVEDYTLVDGEFQGEQYYEHKLPEISEWLKVEPLEMPDDLCVIGFRGGEYVGIDDLFLEQDWWNTAIAWMRSMHPAIKFRVVTDDVWTAKRFFPDIEVTHEIGMDWRQVRYAKHLIISNSSFYILPALLNENVKEIIAPKFWAGHNKGYWQLKQNQYKKFTYL